MPSSSLHKSVKLEFVSTCRHISHVTSELVWISDGKNLILTNIEGEKLNHLTDILDGWGIHTVNNEGDLIYIDEKYNINKLSNDNKQKTTLIKNKYMLPWRPRCVYSSPSTGNLLVGMSDAVRKTAKVVRYNFPERRVSNERDYNFKVEVIQTIQQDNKGQGLYKDPRYITENHNGDIIVSDSLWGVVVTNPAGEYRFSFRKNPSGSMLLPYGICTDTMSQIFVCDFKTQSVYMIHGNGESIAQILTPKHGIDRPQSLSYDDINNLLWFGSANKLFRCKYGNAQNNSNTGDETESDSCVDSLDLSSSFDSGIHQEKDLERQKNALSEENKGKDANTGDETESDSCVDSLDLSISFDSGIHQEKDIEKQINAISGENKGRDEWVSIRLNTSLRRSNSSEQINTLTRNKSMSESQVMLSRIGYIDCSGICGRSIAHCSSEQIADCEESNKQDIFKWTCYCSQKMEEVRSNKCKCLFNTLSVLITIKTNMILRRVKENEDQIEIIKDFLDFAIETRNYILITKLVCLYGYHFDFGFDTIFSKGISTVSTLVVDTILQSVKQMILRKYPSLLRNSIQLSFCYDCGKEYQLTLVILHKGTVEFDFTQETVMGKKPVFYNETKPSDEAYSVLRSFPTTFDRKPLPTITAKEARKLFDEHSNLTMISASPYKSTGYSKGKHKLVKGHCILLLCLHKGYIPYGEEEFPRTIGRFEVDIQEGHCMFGIGGSLEIGGLIRRKGSKSVGSIGGFVNKNGKIGLITCAHGILSLFELESRYIDRDNNADDVEAFVRKYRSFKVCGKIVSAEFPKNNEPIECSVDAAFIELDSSFSVAGFRNIPAEQFISAGFDAHNPVVFRGTVILNEMIGDTSGSVLKFGSRTGLTLGSLFNENMHVRIKHKEALKLYDSVGYTDIPCDVNVYNQLEIESLTHDNFFEVGDSGSFVFCIQDDTLCCIGMAIGLTTRGTCLVTPIENILKSLGLPVNDSIFIPAEIKLQSSMETDRILQAIDRQQKYIDRRFQEQKEEIEKYIEKIKKNE